MENRFSTALFSGERSSPFLLQRRMSLRLMCARGSTLCSLLPPAPPSPSAEALQTPSLRCSDPLGLCVGFLAVHGASNLLSNLFLIFFSMEMIFKQHKISHSEVDNSVAFHAFLMLCNHQLHLEQESSIPGAVRNQAAQQEETGS